MRKSWRESGLAGVEAYASRTLSQLIQTLPPIEGAGEIKESIGVGGGKHLLNVFAVGCKAV